MKPNNRKCVVAALLAVLLLLSAVPPVGTGATDSETLVPQEAYSVPSVIQEGTYRIRNVETGLYLHAFVYYKNNSVTHRILAAPLDAKENGQCFVLAKDGKDCWTLTPKNDNMQYCVVCESGAPGSQVTKAKNPGEEGRFDIIPVGDYFTIAPSYGENLRAVVSVGSEAYKQDYFCEVSDYGRGNGAQLWALEPISTTGLTVAWKQTKLKLYVTGVFGAAMMPEGETVTDARWISSDESVLLVGNDGTYCALGTGKASVTVTKDGYTAGFDVTVVNEDCFTWYSQNSVSGSDWDASLLTSQYWYTNLGRMRYMWDGASPYNYTNCMDTGCALCSVASVLHNMGAVMNSEFFDFRTGQSQNLPADPYTVSLANTNQRDIRSGTGNYAGDPTYMAWNRVAEAFSVDGDIVKCRRIYYPTRLQLKNLLAAHPQGVVIQLSRGESTHYVVASECLNPEEKVASKLEFRIFDPAAYRPEDGENVKFGDSISYWGMAYRYGNMTGLLVFDTESNIDK